MTIPETSRAWYRTAPPYPLQVASRNESVPKPSSTQVLIRVHAVSLNYRDIAMLREGGYPAPADIEGIAASDCAAEVVAVGSAVQKFAIGDHVAPTFNLLNITGDERVNDNIALGGNGPGVLREYVAFEEDALVKLPGYLSWEEASTLACAGVTAWTSLDSLKNVKKDTVVLLQGTGGVSLMALLICLAANIKVIITSSSDEKLASLKKLGDIEVINYKTTPDVTAEALRLTKGMGVDYVVNNIGLNSIPADLKSLRKNGTISLVGFLGGFEPTFPVSELSLLFLKMAKIQTIGVGSRLDFEAFNRFLEEKKLPLKSAIDRVFEFNDSPAAFEYLASGKHTGKVVIKI